MKDFTQQLLDRIETIEEQLAGTAPIEAIRARDIKLVTGDQGELTAIDIDFDGSGYPRVQLYDLTNRGQKRLRMLSTPDGGHIDVRDGDGIERIRISVEESKEGQSVARIRRKDNPKDGFQELK